MKFKNWNQIQNYLDKENIPHRIDEYKNKKRVHLYFDSDLEKNMLYRKLFYFEKVSESTKTINEYMKLRSFAKNGNLKYVNEEGFYDWINYQFSDRLDGTLQLHIPRKRMENGILFNRKPNFKEGGIKPSGDKPLWTSTAYENDDGYSSEWSEWVNSSMPEWNLGYGFLYKVNSKKLIEVITDYEVDEIIENYLKRDLRKNDIENHYKEEFKMYSFFPWDKIVHNFDGLRVPYIFRDLESIGFTYSYDVESTVWFNMNCLEYVGKVPISKKGIYDDDFD